MIDAIPAAPNTYALVVTWDTLDGESGKFDVEGRAAVVVGWERGITERGDPDVWEPLLVVSDADGSSTAAPSARPGSRSATQHITPALPSCRQGSISRMCARPRATSPKGSSTTRPRPHDRRRAGRPDTGRSCPVIGYPGGAVNECHSVSRGGPPGPQARRPGRTTNTTQGRAER